MKQTLHYLLILPLLLGCSFSQVPGPPASDPQAVAFATLALNALTGGIVVRDATLTANVTQIFGTPDTGSVLLKARSLQQSRADFNVGPLRRSDSLAQANGSRVMAWTGFGMQPHVTGLRNLWIDGGWFFPALSSLADTTGGNAVFAYIGQESRNGISVQHIRLWRSASGQSADQAAQIQPLTTDYYLDSSTLLPLEISSSTCIDNDPSTEVLTEVRFSNYRTVSGITTPFHIQRFINGDLVLDLAVQSLAINTGLQDRDFSLE